MQLRVGSPRLEHRWGQRMNPIWLYFPTWYRIDNVPSCHVSDYVAFIVETETCSQDLILSPGEKSMLGVHRRKPHRATFSNMVCDMLPLSLSQQS